MQNIDPKLLAFQEKLKHVKSTAELTGKDGLLTNLFKDTLQNLLEAELTNHLGYPKNLKILAPDSSNKRNGSYKKKLRTDFGDAELEIPRDRNGEEAPSSYTLFKIGVQFKKNWLVLRNDRKFKTNGRVYIEEGIPVVSQELSVV